MPHIPATSFDASSPVLNVVSGEAFSLWVRGCGKRGLPFHTVPEPERRLALGFTTAKSSQGIGLMESVHGRKGI